MSLVRTDGQGRMSNNGWCGIIRCAAVGSKFGGSGISESGSCWERVRRDVMSHIVSWQPRRDAISDPAFMTLRTGISIVVSSGKVN